VFDAWLGPKWACGPPGGARCQLALIEPHAGARYGPTMTMPERGVILGAGARVRTPAFRQADDGYALVNTGWPYYLVSLEQYWKSDRGRRTRISVARIVRGPTSG
jgi:hypothetical protein